MAANAIDNTNLVQGACNFSCNIAGFTPVVTYEYDAEAATVTVTDGSTLPAGDTLKKIRARVIDKNGLEVRGAISALAGNVVIDVSTLDRSKPINLCVTITTANHIAADGIAVNLGAAGPVGSWDSQQNA